MAQRRMFSKSITNSSQFLMMPQSSQNLYFHLGMNADDDGFCEHFSIMRMTDSKPDDLKVLQAKSFVAVFDDRVLVVIDWKENNYLRSDRYTPSKYLAIYKEELKLLAQNKDISGIPDGNQRYPQVRLGKVRLGKDTIAETSSADISELIKLFEEVNPTCKTYYGNTTQRKACQFLLDTYGLEKVSRVIKEVLPKTNGKEYFPSITTPVQLREKWTSLETNYKAYVSKLKSQKEKQGNVY